MNRYIFLQCILVIALGCNVERPSATSEAPFDRELVSQEGDSDESWTVTGEVVDENGLLVDGFDAAAIWSSNGVYWNKEGQVPSDKAGRLAIWKQEGVLAVRPAYSATKTSKGAFTLTIERRQQVPVFAVNTERTHGGLVLVDRSEADRPIRIQLKPLIRVAAEIFCPETGKSPEWCKVDVYPIGGDVIPLTMCGTYQGKVSFLLPAGEYEFRVSSEELPSRRTRITIPSGIEEFDAGVIELALPTDAEGSPVNIHEFYGKNPPDLEITDARGVSNDVQLKHFRGKWVLLEFWAVWCTPCVGDSIPRLREFYEQHADFRDHFEILAICDTSSDNVKTIQEFEVLSAKLVKDAWGGKDLPFPVLLDGEGRTSKGYGIVQRPTLLLIDPDGNLVKDGDLSMLADLLQDGVRNR